MPHDMELIRTAYDRIVADYDEQWSVHVAKPQRRLTHALNISPGSRCADLGCGTGVDTLEMSRLAAPGEVVAVDPSPGMLGAAQERAHAAGLGLTTRCQGADDFIWQAPDASFDVITLRFCLGYLDWHTALQRLPRLLRAGGRIGILTILASSAPQAYGTYRQMAAELGMARVPMTALASADAIAAQLQVGGASIQASWTHKFRLEFGSGEELARWLQSSGIATHPALSALPPDITAALWKTFAARVEAHRELDVIPLDFHIAGLVARLIS